MSRELSYIYGDVTVIEANLTFESLNEILTNPRNESTSDEPHTESINLPVVCLSPQGIESVLKFVKSETFTNSINKMADSLSSYVGDTVSLKVIPDLENLADIDQETDSETVSSSDSHIEESEYSDRFQRENISKIINGSIAPESNISVLTNENATTSRSDFDEDLSFDKLLEDTRPINEDTNSKEDKDTLLRREKPMKDIKRNNYQEVTSEDSFSEDMKSENLTLKEAFKKDIIKYYKNIHKTLQIGLLMEEGQFFKLYVEPFPIYEIRKKSPDKKIEIRDLKELFKDGSTVCNSIYITSDTGIGKTAFMKWLTLCWCQAHSMNEKIEENDMSNVDTGEENDMSDATTEKENDISNVFTREDIQEMITYEFLFYVSVGDIKCEKYHVDNLVYSSIINALPESDKFEIDFLETILENEKCLIILDGIDECSRGQSNLLPEISKRARLTTLTSCTTRTFERLNIDSHGLDKQIELGVLKKEKSEELSRKIISFFSENDNTVAISSYFSTGIYEELDKFKKWLIEKNLVHFSGHPFLLALLLSTWIAEDKIIDRSQCDIYSKIITEMMRRASAREAFFQQLLRFKTDKPAKEECLEDCGPYFPLFVTLSRLAYCTIFGKISESSLYFDENEATRILTSNKSVPPPEVIELGLNTGILCKKNEEEVNRFLFFHRSVHDFLAAMHMSYNTSAISQVKSKFQSLQSFLEHKDMIVFLSGLNKSLAEEILKHIMQLLQSNETFSNYRCTVNSERPGEIKYIQGMIVDCFIESRNNGMGKVRMSLQDVIVDSSSENKSYRENLKQIISNSVLLTLSIEEYDYQEHFFQKYLLFENLQLPGLQKLKIDGPYILLYIPMIRAFSAVKYVHFKSVVFTHSRASLKRFIDIFQFDSIVALGLEDIYVTHEQAQTIFQMLNRKTTLTQIVCRAIKCMSHTICHGLELCLRNHNKLRILEVYDIPVTTIHTNEKVEDCKIGKLPHGSPSTLFQCITDTSNLKKMVCMHVYAENDIIQMVNGLSKLKKTGLS